jgi:hypothetical protein
MLDREKPPAQGREGREWRIENEVFGNSGTKLEEIWENG